MVNDAADRLCLAAVNADHTKQLEEPDFSNIRDWDKNVIETRWALAYLLLWLLEICEGLPTDYLGK